MTELMVCSCGSPFGGEDAFCGNCGAVRTAPRTTVPRTADPVPPQRARARDQPRPRLGTQYFTHAPGRPPGPMSSATRYLCAAAYLDSAFLNGVIRELISSHRAVVPSSGIDLVPIVRHCLKARKMQLGRDIALCLLLLLGVALARLPLVLILILMFLLGFLPGAHWERRSIGGKALAGTGVVLAVMCVSTIVIVAVLASSLGHAVFGPTTVTFGLIDAVLTVVTLISYSYQRNRTLGAWLSPGAQAPPFERSTERVETRLAEIGAAQHGNLTLYGGEDPFLGRGRPPSKSPGAVAGAGADARAWSICIELNRQGARRDLFSPEPPGRVGIDPVELHGVLRRRLTELNDPRLPPNERAGVITVDDHVAGEGSFEWSSPLVDAKKLIPFSQVRLEAIPALIRNPQARLRYYQRVSISDEGQRVLIGDEEIVNSVDQEVVVSAFIYVAVEGHMFYLQFVPTSLAPIADRYHVIDHLPKVSSARFMSKSVLDAAGSAFRDIIGAPFGLVRTLRLMYRESKSYNEELTYAEDYVYADVGARLSVRQLGARHFPRTYIQQLDVAKYTQLVERLVLETVLDFLVAKGVDTTAYRASAQAIYNSGIIVAGDSRNSNLSVGLPGASWLS